MARTIIVSDETYKELDALRLEIPERRRYESFNEMLTRLVPELKKKVSP